MAQIDADLLRVFLICDNQRNLRAFFIYPKKPDSLRILIKNQFETRCLYYRHKKLLLSGYNTLPPKTPLKGLAGEIKA
jgi:hypothetical protein